MTIWIVNRENAKTMGYQIGKPPKKGDTISLSQDATDTTGPTSSRVECLVLSVEPLSSGNALAMVEVR